MIDLRPLAEEICELAVDADAAAVARQRLFDSLAAVEVGRGIEDVARGRTGADSAARLRFATAAGRATETDDIHVRSCATIGTIVCPAAVLAASAAGVEADDLLAGVVAGYEAMSRLALAIDGATLVYRGTWTTLVCAPVGAAAAVARVFGLSRDETASALGLAASRAVTSAPSGAASRWWAIGCAAADGWLSASAAREGVRTAGPAPFPVAADATVLETPGSRRAILDVDVKALPSARQTLPAVQAVLQAAEGLVPDEIERIAVGVPGQVREMIERSGRPVDRLDSLVDVRYQIALALTGGERLYDAVREPLPAAAPSLSSRVELADDAGLTAAFPAIGARVRVRVRGEEREVVVQAPDGSSEHPFGWAGLERKWERVSAASGSSSERLIRLRHAAAAADHRRLASLLD